MLTNLFLNIKKLKINTINLKGAYFVKIVRILLLILVVIIKIIKIYLEQILEKS